MKQPKIELQIGELILHGIPAALRRDVAAAIEQELTRLLSERGLPPELAQGGSIPHVGVDDMRLAAGAKAGDVGKQIAQGMYSNLQSNNS
jgi:hypothetical protein